LRAVYVSGQYGVILPANFLREKEGMKLKVYNNAVYFGDFTGEVVELSKTGVKSVYMAPRLNNKAPATCIFEYVYFARPDSIMEGTCLKKENSASYCK
jgi:glutamine phosphoribosylpyrophosphate amidotransferase